jgi:hypothetical protein
MGTHPCYQRRKPTPQDPSKFAPDRIDLSSCHLDPYPKPDASGALPDSRPLANSLFDARAAAAVRAAVGDPKNVTIYPKNGSNPLLEQKDYRPNFPVIWIPTSTCLAVMAYEDYFPGEAPFLRQMVSDAIMAASPGWCGTYGPETDDCKPVDPRGDYDMAQMFLLPLAYAYYDEIAPATHATSTAVREKLITQLLAGGHVHRDNVDDTFTSGFVPNDWSRAGYCSAGPLRYSIPETENHVLMIATARYLTNQLLYPRDPRIIHDNRRNAGDDYPSCMGQILFLLRNKLRDDFAEYNAKPYQEETRHALLNLYSYAYDAEVRLAAGMVLDYVSAHFAVSSCDLRRMVPFRRRNEGMKVHHDPSGFMDVSLLESSIPDYGADPMPAHFALHAGNTRAYQFPDDTWWPRTAYDGPPARPWKWAITPNFDTELVLEAVCDHRLAPSVHDLFVNDLHRRFYQRLHRYSMMGEPDQQRNCDNLELYVGSPSYLISAGGRPAIWVIPGRTVGPISRGYDDQNLGVAVPISFMPTRGASYNTIDVIQIMHFSDQPTPENDIDHDLSHGGTENYGVAPDFACGVGAHFPASSGIPENGDGVFFAEHRPTSTELAGYYLAAHRRQDFVALEAFDIWRHPEVSFEAFKSRVLANNPTGVTLVSNQPSFYTTYFGNRIHFVIWNNLELDNHICGSNILSIEYAAGDPADTLVDAGNDTGPFPLPEAMAPNHFLSGNILRYPRDGVVEIHNPSLGTTLTLDWSDPDIPNPKLVRISENGDVQIADVVHQVWVDFDWTGPNAGDFCQPFNTLEGALNAAADGGVIRIMAGAKRERLTIHKRVRLTAAGGAVALRAN